MPGVGDFNLRSFFRAMGIKNPDTSMRETVQPVIVVGNMSDITPVYRPPSGIWGGDVVAVAAEFSFFQITSRAEGGTLIHQFGADGNLQFGTLDAALPATINTDFPLSSQLSVAPPVSLVTTGSVAAIPIPLNESPNTNTATHFPLTGGGFRDMWIRPGNTFIAFRSTVNQSAGDWLLWATDLPASENSIL